MKKSNNCHENTFLFMQVLKVMKHLDKGMVGVHETYMRVKSEYCKSAIHDIQDIITVKV